MSVWVNWPTSITTRVKGSSTSAENGFSPTPGSHRYTNSPAWTLILRSKVSRAMSSHTRYVADQGDRGETHVDVVAHHALGVLAVAFLSRSSSSLASEVAADLLAVEAGQRRADADDIGAGFHRRIHVRGAGEAAAADDGQVTGVADLADALECDRQYTLAGHAADTVGQHRLAVCQGIARPHGIDGAETVGTGLRRGAGDGADIRGIRRQLGDYRDVHGGLHRGHDLRHHRRILAHGHAVAGGMWTGQVQLETVGDRREQFRNGDELVDAAAEDRGQEEAVLRYLQRLEARQGRFGARVGQPHGVHKAARGVLRIDGLAIAGARRSRPMLLVVMTPSCWHLGRKSTG
jgi:hypothetical protein